MKWGKENLAHLGKNDLYFIGNGYNKTLGDDTKKLTPTSSSQDFALLAACNHTIGSRGTFSIWISRFAGGHVITEYAPGYEQFKKSYNNERKINYKRDVSEL